MRVSVLSSKRDSTLLKRLQLIGFGVQFVDTESIRNIDRHETDLVYLVSNDLMLSEEWAELRVRLARAGRYYVVFGFDLQSREIVAAARDGAHDVVNDGDSDERWVEAIREAGEAQQLWRQLYGGSGQTDSSLLTGRSSAMKTLRESVERLGPTEATVLITGESGAGKERVAEALHVAAGKGSFVAVNCAAIPKNLMESELFGVEKGAFTGAVRDKPGLVEEAAGGTLFLDEIGELEVFLQPKLLRFLETHHARRVGSTKEYQCDVRVVSATNRDLEGAVDEGGFRPDLYYRLSEVIVHLPPLRHRVEDIPDLVSLFIETSAERNGKNFESIDPELIHRFQQYDWPGNIRELKQAIDRMAILYDGPVMRKAWWEMPKKPEPRAQRLGLYGRGDDRDEISLRVSEGNDAVAGRYGVPSRKEKMSLASRLLKEDGHDLTWVAAQLGIHPTTLYRWRKAGKV